VIKYLGSKRLLLPRIVELVRSAPGATEVIDLFSGTSRVGHALKAEGFRVLANDHNAYAHALARCYVEADREDVLERAEKLLGELAKLPPREGWFTESFAHRTRYLQPKNAARIEAIREEIAQRALDPLLESVLLVSLMEAADRVDSTTGVQMAYLKGWSARSNNDLAMRMPAVLSRAKGGRGEAHALDALDAARKLSAHVAYVDPPYNQHSYLGNYHVWETLVRWDAPESYGIAGKRVDVKERKSPFNRRHEIGPALEAVLDAIDAHTLIVSFSDEGWLTREQIESMCRKRGDVSVIEHDYKRYVGAQIGIYNPSGEKVGKVSHLRNVEYLFVVSARTRATPSTATAGEGGGDGQVDKAARAPGLTPRPRTTALASPALPTQLPLDWETRAAPAEAPSRAGTRRARRAPPRP
jgi:adenine-specific DNA-methyltransferase